jgi:hypothetical protein
MTRFLSGELGVQVLTVSSERKIRGSSLISAGSSR